jgi:predicted phosphodiesterase
MSLTALRIAVIADIHGNVAALEAVLADAAGRGTIDLTVNLGDCVSGPLWPAATCELLRDRSARETWVTVRGNHDRVVACNDPADMGESDAFAHAHLDADARAWLGALPTLAEVAPGVVAFHGRPDDDNRYLLDEIAGGRLIGARPAIVAARLGELVATATRLVLCGHSHQARLLQLPDGPLVLNPGSVGCPAYDDPNGPAHVSEAGSPHARYAIVEFEGEGAPRVNLIAVPYDHMAASHRAAANGRSGWAHALATGFYPAAGP